MMMRSSLGHQILLNSTTLYLIHKSLETPSILGRDQNLLLFGFAWYKKLTTRSYLEA